MPVAWMIRGAMLATALGTASGQGARPAHLRGHVTDKTSHHGIPGAQVILESDGRYVTSDSTGAYDFAAIPKGVVQLSVRASMFAVGHYSLQLIGMGDWTQDVELDSTAAAIQPIRLETTKVTADAPPAGSYRLRDFDLRRANGRGQYLTDKQIRASGASNIQDAVANMRGVRLDCGGTAFAGCRIRMLSAPQRCPPQYYVDGQLDNEFGPMTPIRDVIAMEVYTGPAEVPGDFAGRDSGCGVIVLWTRSGPDPKPRAKAP